MRRQRRERAWEHPRVVDARRAAAAGIFYPAERDELTRVVRAMLDAAPRAAGKRARAIVAPHGAWAIAGETIAAAWARVAQNARRIERVVLLGAAHHDRFAGLAAPFADSFATPLGTLPIDRLAIESARRFPQMVVSDVPHDCEHSIEVQLPFVQTALGAPLIVPLVVGEATDEEAAQVIDALWNESTLVVVCADLSHYYDAETAARIDGGTSRAIESLDDGAIGIEQTCAPAALRALLRVARRRGLRGCTLDLRNSGSNDGSRDEVVGYGAFAIA